MVKKILKTFGKRLTTEFSGVNNDSLCDCLSVMASDIEDAMIQSGAEPGKDYTYLDLFKLVAIIHAGRLASGVKF